MADLVFHDPTGRRARARAPDRAACWWLLRRAAGGRLLRHPGLRAAPAEPDAEGPAGAAGPARGDRAQAEGPAASGTASRTRATRRGRRRRRGRCRSASTSPGTRARGNPWPTTSTSWTWSRRSGSRWTARDGALTITSDPQARAIIASAKKPPSILPGVSTTTPRDGVWNGPHGRRRCCSTRRPAPALIANLVGQAQKRGYAGYVFDFENLSPAGAQAYPGFIAQARAALKPLGREVWVTAPFADDSLAAEGAAGRRRRGGADGLRPALGHRRARAAGRPGLVRDARSPSDMADARPGQDGRGAGRLRLRLDPARRQGQARPAEAVTLQRGHPDARTTPRPRSRWTRTRSTRPSATQDDDRPQARGLVPGRARPCSTRSRSPTASGRMGYALWRMGGEDQLRLEAAAPRLRPGQPDGPGGAEARRRTSTSTAPARCCRSSDTPTPGHRTLEIDPDTGLISGENYDVHADLLCDPALRLPSGLGGADLRRRAGRALDAEDPRHPQGQARPGDLLRDRQEHAARARTWWRARCARATTSAATPGPTRTSARSRPAQTAVELTRPPSGCSRPSPAAPCACSGRPIFGDAEPSTPREVRAAAGRPDSRAT